MQPAASIHVRQLSEDDAQALWDLRLCALTTDPQAFRETADHHRATPVELHRERLRSSSNNAIYGAFCGGMLIGMVGIHRLPEPHANRARIWGMFILPDYRGIGAGTAALLSSIDHARSWPGVTEIELAVAASQESAKRMYLRQAFVPTGTIDDAGNEQMTRKL
jgi:RimJ/RimL family protein N-acetyltransferase